MTKTFLFMYKDLGMGGIETYIIRTMRKLRKENYRIIWLAPRGGIVDEEFKAEIFDGYIDIIEVDLDNFNWIDKLDIKFDNNEEVTALAFNLFHFIFLEMVKNKYNQTRINDFFWVPHFKEKEVFLEEFAPKPLRSILRKYIGKIIYSMEQNDNIIYVNQTHLDAFTRTYGYKVENEKEKLLTESNRCILPYNNELALKRSERKEFNIISVGRFSFPHKEYIVGLIRVYGELKEKYDKLKLTIIGYGQDEDKVIIEIEKLTPNAKKDLNFIGRIAYDDLKKYFKEAHLNIGVASTIAEGALTGLISIPVRHYTEICEGYGYLPYSRNYTTSSEPGEPIEKFIEEVINMDRNKYLELSRKSYDAYVPENDKNPTDDLLERKNKNLNKTLQNKYILSIRCGFKVAKVVRSMKNMVSKFCLN